MSISALVMDLSDVFLKNEEAILKGDYDRPLMEASRLKDAVGEIIKISVSKIYQSPKVLAMESAGFEILNGLMNTFVDAINEVHSGEGRYSSGLVVKQLPAECFDLNGKIDEDLYLRLVKVTSYVASMTDSQAIRLYRQLKGIELPK